jgi:hypothetical protein
VPKQAKKESGFSPWYGNPGQEIITGKHPKSSSHILHDHEYEHGPQIIAV